MPSPQLGASSPAPSAPAPAPAPAPSARPGPGPLPAASAYSTMARGRRSEPYPQRSRCQTSRGAPAPAEGDARHHCAPIPGCSAGAGDAVSPRGDTAPAQGALWLLSAGPEGPSCREPGESKHFSRVRKERKKAPRGAGRPAALGPTGPGSVPHRPCALPIHPGRPPVPLPVSAACVCVRACVGVRRPRAAIPWWWSVSAGAPCC